jgi:DNA ligase-1
MLAADTPEDLKVFNEYKLWPLLGSYKIDGIRATQVGGVLVSRSGKPIRSAYAQKFAHPELEGLDGELIPEREPVGETLFQAATSAVMTIGSTEPLRWLVFDVVSENHYTDRYHKMREMVKVAHSSVQPLEQRELRGVDDILTMEKEAIELGHEGLVVRTLWSKGYKQGRSTLRQGYLVKIARRKNSEATVVGFEEMMHNDNPAYLNEVGYTKRSVSQDGLRPSGMLGAFVVCDLKSGLQFRVGIGEGLDHAMRKHVWENQKEYLGRIMKYDYKDYGTAELPRMPRWLGWRSPEDM